MMLVSILKRLTCWLAAHFTGLLRARKPQLWSDMLRKIKSLGCDTALFRVLHETKMSIHVHAGKSTPNVFSRTTRSNCRVVVFLSKVWQISAPKYNYHRKILSLNKRLCSDWHKKRTLTLGSAIITQMLTDYGNCVRGSNPKLWTPFAFSCSHFLL